MSTPPTLLMGYGTLYLSGSVTSDIRRLRKKHLLTYLTSSRLVWKVKVKLGKQLRRSAIKLRPTYTAARW